jgi:nucleotide-binding universal stress UspA family protein
MPGIIVGVDGSDHSRRALGWAMREAAHHHVPLTVLSIHPPRPVRPPEFTGVCTPTPRTALTRSWRGWQYRNSWTKSRGKSARRYPRSP